MKLSSIRKSVTAFVGAGLTWAGVAYIPDGHVTRVEWFALAVAVATVAGVYGVTNEPADPPAIVTPDAPPSLADVHLNPAPPSV